jgi:protein-tyrosine phosphatase
MITDNLFLGAEEDAFSREFMTEKPTAVLNCAKELEKSPHCDGYLHLQLEDTQAQRLAPNIPLAIEFIEEQLLNGKRVLVHCRAGVSRSVSIVIGYLMSSHGMTFLEAFDYVKSKRKQANPNFGFVCQMHAYGEELAGVEESAELV